MQLRLQESQQRCDLMQRLNENLADDYGKALEELDALKRTVIDSHKMVIPAQVQEAEQEQSVDSLVVPSFLRVMEAE